MNFFSKKIKKIEAQSILDSRGYPTIECKLTLSSGTSVIASVPTGMSVGPYESKPLYDNNPHIFDGKSVDKAITLINTVIAHACQKQKPDIESIDSILKHLNTTHKKSLGSNVMLAVSWATLKAAASLENLPLYQYIGLLTQTKINQMPRIIANVINGGMHAHNHITMQEFCIINKDPTVSIDGRHAIIETYHQLKKYLHQQGINLAVGDEGGFAGFCSLRSTEEILTLLTHIKNTSPTSLTLGIDAAASTWHDAEKHLYSLDQQAYQALDLNNYYKSLIQKYDISMLEDPFSESDETNWNQLTKINTTMIVADDLCASHLDRLNHIIENNLAHAIIIKPNQVETVSDILQTVDKAQKQNIQLIASHRSGETLDTSIVDLAVGIGAWGIKMGAPARGERIAKYNRYASILKEFFS